MAVHLSSVTSARPIKEDSYFEKTEVSVSFERNFERGSPRYYLAKELYRLKLVNTHGIVSPELLQRQMPDLNPREFQDIVDFLKQKIIIKSADGLTQCETSLADILTVYNTPFRVVPELVGGIVSYLLAKYFRRVCVDELHLTLTEKMEPCFDALAVLPNDADTRLHVSSLVFNVLREQKETLGTKSLDELRSLISQLQRNFGIDKCGKSTRLLRDCYRDVETIENLRSALKLEMLGLIHYELEKYQNAFSEILPAGSVKTTAQLPAEKKHFIIMDLMAYVEAWGAFFRYDFLLVDQLPTFHLFTRDAIRLDARPFLSQGFCSARPISDKGKQDIEAWQAFFDRLLGVVRPEDLALLDEFAWPMLQVYKAKGALLLGFVGQDLKSVEETLLKKLAPEPEVIGDKLQLCWKKHLGQDPELLKLLAFHASDSVARLYGHRAGVNLWNYLLPTQTMTSRIETFMPRQPSFLDRLIQQQPEIGAALCKRNYLVATTAEIDAAFRIHVQSRPEQGLLELKERWSKHVSPQAKAGAMVEVVRHFFTKDPYEGLELLQVEKLFEPVLQDDLRRLEADIVTHVEQLKSDGNNDALLKLLKIPLIKQKLSKVYTQVLEHLMRSHTGHNSLTIELAVLAFERNLDHAFVPFFAAFRPGVELPVSFIKMVVQGQNSMLKRLKEKNLPLLAFDFIGACERHNIDMSPFGLSQIFWIVESVPLPQHVRYFVHAMRHVSPPQSAVAKILPVCTIQEAVTILKEAKNSAALLLWEGLQKRATTPRELDLVLTGFGGYLLHTQESVSIDVTPWLRRDGLRTQAAELLKKYRPQTPAAWKDVFDEMGKTSKTKVKHAVYTIWKEEERFHSSPELKSGAVALLIESGHPELLEIAQRLARDELRSLLVHPKVSFVLSKEKINTLLLGFVKKCLEEALSTKEVIDIIRFLFDHYHQLPKEDDKAVYPLLDLAYEHIILEFIRGGDILQFSADLEMVVELLATRFFKLSPQMKVEVHRDAPFYVALTYNPASCNGREKDKLKVHTLNALFVHTALRVSCPDALMRQHLQAILKSAFQFLFQTKCPAAAFLELFEEFIYYTQASPEEAYFDHLKDCYFLCQLAYENFFQTKDIAASCKMNEIIWYLTTVLPGNLPGVSATQMIAERETIDTIRFSSFENVFKSRLDLMHPFGAWRALFLLQQLVSDLVRAHATDRLLNCLTSLFSHILCDPFYTPPAVVLRSRGDEAGDVMQKHFRVLASYCHLPAIDIIRSYAKSDSASGFGVAKEAVVALVVSFIAQVIRQEQEKCSPASSWRAFILMKNSAKLFLQNNMHEDLRAFCATFAFFEEPVPWQEFPKVHELRQKYGVPPNLLEIAQKERLDSETLALLSLKETTLGQSLALFIKEHFGPDDPSVQDLAVRLSQLHL